MTNPTGVTALFDAPGVSLHSIGNNVQTPATVAQSNPLNPETISLAALVLGMLLIALVSVGGFTVLAQRRLRSIGMLEATGATDRHVRLVVQRQRHRGRGGRCRARRGRRAGGLARLSSRARTERAPRHPRVGAALGRRRRRGRARRGGGVLRRLPSGSGHHQDPHRPGALGASDATPPGAPLGRPRHRLPRPGLLVARLRRGHESRQRRRRRPRAPVRHRPAHPRAHPAGTFLLVAGGAPRPRGTAGDTAVAARPGPLPGPIGLGPGRHQRGGARRHDRDAGGRGPLRQRPRLRRPQPGLEPVGPALPGAAPAGHSRHRANGSHVVKQPTSAVGDPGPAPGRRRLRSPRRSAPSSSPSRPPNAG